MENNKSKWRSKIGVYALATTLAVVAAGGAGFGIAFGAYYNPEEKKEHEIVIDQSIETHGYNINVNPTKAKKGDKVTFTVSSNSNTTYEPKAIRITSVPSEEGKQGVSTDYVLTKKANKTYEVEVVIVHTTKMKVDLIFDELSDWVVKFDLDGGTGDNTTQYIVRGNYVTRPTDPTKTGHDFDNWYIEGESLPFDFDNRIIDHDITLKAKWNVHKHTVYWKNWDGSELETDTNVAYGTTPTYDGTTPVRPSSPEGKYTYTFTGWDKKIVAMPDEDVTYTAQYSEAINKYTVTFATDGGSFVAPQTLDYGSKITEPDITKEGYTLDGWYNGATKWNFATDTLTSNITLTAKWTINQYTVTFDSDGGSAVNPITQNYNTTITKPTAPTKAGYDFKGWYYDGAQVSFPYTIKKNVTFKAVWDEAYVTVSFDSKLGSSVGSQTVQRDVGVATRPTDPTREGYTFDYWYDTDETKSWNWADHFSANKTLNAHWTQNKYTVKFDANGGECTVTEKTDIPHGSTIGIAEPTPTYEHFTFDGWYDGDTKWNFATSTVTKDLTLKAKWTPITAYTVSFDTQGGSAIAAQKVYDGEHPTAPGTPTKTGHTFKGWFEAATGGEAITDWTTQTISANKTYYAQWTPIEYTVTFHKKDGTTEATRNVKYGQPISDMPDVPAETGFETKGWSYSDTEYKPFDESTLITNNIELYAYYEQITVTGIEIVSYPTNITYYRESGTPHQTLDLNGMSVKLIKSYGNPEVVSDFSTGWTKEGFAVKDTGFIPITLTHTTSGKSVVFKIEVVPQYNSLQIDEIPESIKTFYKGQDFTANGLKVHLDDYKGDRAEEQTFEEGTTAGNYELEGGDTSTLGMHDVVVKHTSGLNALYTINVVDQYKSLTIKTVPTAIQTVVKGTSYEPTGLVVTLTDYNGDKKDYTYDDDWLSELEVSDVDTSTTGLKTVTVTYNDDEGHTSKPLTASFTINVVDQYSSIVVDTPATTTTFVKGGTFDTKGLKLHVVDYNGQSQDIEECTTGTTFTNYTVTAPDLTSTGLKTVKIKHNTSGLETTYAINVVEQYKSMVITKFPTKMTFKGGIGNWENFVYDGLEITLTDYNGNPEVVTFNGQATDDWETNPQYWDIMGGEPGDVQTVTFTHKDSGLKVSYQVFYV